MFAAIRTSCPSRNIKGRFFFKLWGREFSLSWFIVFYLEEVGIAFRERSVASYLQAKPSSIYNYDTWFHSVSGLLREKSNERELEEENFYAEIKLENA